MSDNTTLPGTGEVYASDDIGGIKHQRVKISVGADGSAVDLSSAAPLPIGDSKLDVSRGLIAGQTAVNKFGRNTDIDTGVAEDIWDAGGTWVAPTAARTHQIVSSSASDASAGVGARTIQVCGLQTWASVETSETVTLNGTTNVPTANTYVIIHRMAVLTKGATSVNVGNITATADTDATVTAQISAGLGQTLMCVYGVPSAHKAYMTCYYGSLNESGGSVVDFRLLVNPEPDVELTNFLTKHLNAASSHYQHVFAPYNAIAGPAIIKIQGTSSANNTDVTAGFDMIVVAN